MASLRKRIQSYPLIPEEERKCIWMTTGFISYKLCDRSYQCEACPLDQAIKNDEPGEDDFQESEETGMEESLKSDFSTQIDGAIFYHPDHCWVQVENPEKVKIGIDDLLAELIMNIKVVILPRAGSFYVKAPGPGKDDDLYVHDKLGQKIIDSYFHLLRIFHLHPAMVRVIEDSSVNLRGEITFQRLLHPGLFRFLKIIFTRLIIFDGLVKGAGFTLIASIAQLVRYKSGCHPDTLPLLFRNQGITLNSFSQGSHFMFRLDLL